MRKLTQAIIFAAALEFLARGGSNVVLAGTAAEAAADQEPRAVNLKVLPKDTSMADVSKTMLQMQRGLGVQCGFCHDTDADTKKVDFVSDDNPRKETARTMMRMTNEINDKYLGRLGDPQEVARINCGNCHQGQMHPPAFRSPQ